MNGKSFVDTHILVYAYDKHDAAKQAKARSVLQDGIGAGALVVSAQVLGEFFVTVTRKVSEPLSASEALRIIRLFSIVPAIEIDRTLVHAAVAHHQRHQISYWDGLIIAAAERGGCERVLSEDLNHGQRYGTVTVENPFM